MAGKLIGIDIRLIFWITSKWLTVSNLDSPSIHPSVSDVESNPEVESEQDEIFDDVSQQLLQRLVQQHLWAVMESDLSQFSTYPRHDDITPETLSFMSTIIAYALEQDHDIVLSALLKAAIKVKDDIPGEHSGVVGEFLQRVVDLVRHVGADTGSKFLQTTLESLLRKDLSAGGTGNTAPPDTHNTSPWLGMNISIGNDTMELALADILDCFWANRLHTKCHWCHQAFGENPPIWMICVGAEIRSSTRNIHVRIFNRHFTCLRSSGALIVPVSHVWNSSIREANRSKQYTAEAASTMIASIHTLFESSQGSYSPQVEFWHDYYSVPQWNKQIRQSLLLALPLIFHNANEILVQMSDITPHHVHELYEASLLPNISLYQCLKLIPPLRALCASEWMQRMWVTLEYCSSKSACIMDQSNRIWRSVEREEMFNRDTFSRLVDGSQRVLLSMFQYAARFSRELSTPGEFLGGLADRRGHFRQMCLGEAVELVARKQCQYFRDRFLAISIILQRDSIFSSSENVPTSDGDACAMVWKGALQRGDFSPLLFHPCEKRRGAIPGGSTPSWFVGYQNLDDVDWNLGDEKQSSELQIIISNDTVETEHEFVGTIDEVQWLDVEDSGEVAGVDWTTRFLADIARSEGTTLSAERLVEGLNRVFPFDFNHTKAANVLHGMVFSFQGLQEQDEGFEASIDTQLVEYHGAPEGEAGITQREVAVKEIARILELERSIMQFAAPVTRLTRSRHIARRRRDRGVESGEPICMIQCPECSTRSLLRLDLRPTATLGAKIYRIPSLTYSDGVQGGIGIVLQDGRIVGRMLYGAPVCSCRLPEVVQII
ncbi:MAG: hypothetical protein Q9198_000841 [Flavoplaca austrocitrina]